MNLHEELTLKVKEVIEDYEHMLYTDPWVLYDKVADLIEQELQSRLASMVDEEGVIKSQADLPKTPGGFINIPEALKMQHALDKLKCKECQSWHDGALDWRESEIAKAVKAERTDNKCG